MMQLGEIGLLTHDFVRLAGFYKWLLGVDNQSEDPVHQCILSSPLMLTVYNDGSIKNNANENLCRAFTVDDPDAEYARLLKKGVKIIASPQTQPWGTRNLCFLDPDGNRVYLRSFVK